MTKLANKKALVLGASRGIGAAVVTRLVQEGADTTFTYANSAQLARELVEKTGGETTGAKAIQVDSTNRDALTQVISEQGELDILVVVAGSCVMADPLEINLNVRSPYHASVEAARKMKDGGRIIIIGSVNDDRMPMAGGTSALTKSDMQGLVRDLARDLGHKNITVNNIQPKDHMHSFMAIKRQTEEIVDMMVYLAGPEAGRITGSQQIVGLAELKKEPSRKTFPFHALAFGFSPRAR